MGCEDKGRGLYQKFRVERTDGSSAPGGRHDGCRYFVLDLDHDPFAKDALKAYAGACEGRYPALAADLAATLPTMAAALPPERGWYMSPDQMPGERLAGMSDADLDMFWQFVWDPAQSPSWNLYLFHHHLAKYRTLVFRWERLRRTGLTQAELERKYLEPKLRAFAERMLRTV